jgi:NAD(P)-dependent dehydrogenase (short-subunit alcohol dehydrogenase family)
LNRRYASDGIIAVSLHPGVIETELWRHSGTIFQMNKTIPQGAATSVFCCVSPTVEGGKYYNDCQVSEAAEYATNAEYAEKLWNISLELTSSK